MSYKIIFHPLADLEFGDAFEWYEDRLSGLGVRFSDSVENCLSKISQSPLIFKKRKKSYREAKVDTFPYLIVFKIISRKKTILISAIHHTSRNPKTKFRK